MKFRTEIPEVEPNFKIDFRSRIVMLGSCFTNNIGNRLEELQFETFINPYNIVFNPMSLHQQLSQKVKNQAHFINQNNKVFTLDCHSKFNGNSVEDLNSKIEDANNSLKDKLSETDVLILTFGTAWVYRYKKSGKVIANCQKQLIDDFNKELLSLSELKISYAKLFDSLIEKNGSIRVVLTVSPVRHLKDGLVDNNRSKAVLLCLCQYLEEKYPDNIIYYPSYEIMIDDLRDYRFYDKDLLHPNDVAVDYIFDHFKRSFMTDKSIKTMQLIVKYNKLKNHKDLHSSANEKVERENKLLEMQKEIAKSKLS